MNKNVQEKTSKLKQFFNQRFDRTNQNTYAYFSRPTRVDRIMQYTILPFIPEWVVPNYLTILRYLLIPVTLSFLLAGETSIAFILFVVAAFTDAIDGAIARVRRRITDWGILHDPLADKLLIGSVAILVITTYISPWVTAAIVGLEVAMIVTAYSRYRGHAVPAKTVGKIKMVLQSVGVATILCGVAFGLPGFVVAAEYILYVAIVFALLSFLVYRSI